MPKKTRSSKTGYNSDVSDEEWVFCAPYLALMKEDAAQRGCLQGFHHLSGGMPGQAMTTPRLASAGLPLLNRETAEGWIHIVPKGNSRMPKRA